MGLFKDFKDDFSQAQGINTEERNRLPVKW